MKHVVSCALAVTLLAACSKDFGPTAPEEPGSRIVIRAYNEISSGSGGVRTDKDDYLKRLRRIEGQIRGLQRMVDDETYCIDILTQASAATKALQTVAVGLLDDHLAHCVVDAARDGGPDADAKLKEASDAIARLVRA